MIGFSITFVKLKYYIRTIQFNSAFHQLVLNLMIVDATDREALRKRNYVSK